MPAYEKLNCDKDENNFIQLLPITKESSAGYNLERGIKFKPRLYSKVGYDLDALQCAENVVF